MTLLRLLFAVLAVCCACVSCQVLVHHENLVQRLLEGLANSSARLTDDSAVLCQQHLKYYFTRLFNETWAFQLFDSSSKIPTAIYAGNIADLGFFDECLAVEHHRQHDTIRGKYCKAAIPLERIMTGIIGKEIQVSEMQKRLHSRGAMNLNSVVPSLTVALCVPDSCDVASMNSLLTGTPVKKLLDVSLLNCQSSESEPLSAGTSVAVAFFVLILAVMVSSTAYDLYLNHNGTAPAHLILVAFSMFTNGKKLLSVNKHPGQLECVNGIRFISMMWVVIGHTHYTAFFSPSINARDALTWGEKPSSMYVLGATISVDSFFVLGGMLMSYVTLSAKAKGIPFNIIMYYAHRYIRLTPSLAAMVLLHVTLLRYFGSGPYWPETTNYLEENCQKYWWSTLLYVQNYVNPGAVCISQTWYLSVDMQLFILSPALLIPLGKWPRNTLLVSALLVVLSVVSPFVVAWVNEMPGLVSEAIFKVGFAKLYYFNTYVRYGSTVVGIILGYYVYHRKTNTKLNMMFKNKYLIVLGWLLSFGSLVVITFAPNNMFNHPYNRLESSMFLGFHRVAWSIALAWIIYACLLGYGGFINSFLSLSAFQVLGRLTYSMYLIHLSLQLMKLGYLRVPIYFSDFQNMYNFWGDFVFTAAAAVIWTLAFESPILILEKIIFKGSVKKPVKSENRNGIKNET